MLTAERVSIDNGNVERGSGSKGWFVCGAKRALISVWRFFRLIALPVRHPSSLLLSTLTESAFHRRRGRIATMGSSSAASA